MNESLVTYTAASVPRYMRTARLGYLPLSAVIGSRSIGGIAYDIIMLPAHEFMRARHYLASAAVNPFMALERTKITPPYIPQDIQEVTVLAGAANPTALAAQHFLQAFGLLDKTRDADQASA